MIIPGISYGIARADVAVPDDALWVSYPYARGAQVLDKLMDWKTPGGAMFGLEHRLLPSTKVSALHEFVSGVAADPDPDFYVAVIDSKWNEKNIEKLGAQLGFLASSSKRLVLRFETTNAGVMTFAAKFAPRVMASDLKLFVGGFMFPETYWHRVEAAKEETKVDSGWEEQTRLMYQADGRNYMVVIYKEVA